MSTLVFNNMYGQTEREREREGERERERERENWALDSCQGPGGLDRGNDFMNGVSRRERYLRTSIFRQYRDATSWMLDFRDRCETCVDVSR